jgi:hypothetical protein
MLCDFQLKGMFPLRGIEFPKERMILASSMGYE